MSHLTPEVEQNFSDWQRSLAIRGKAMPDSVAESQKELHRVVSEGPLILAAYLRVQLGIDTEESIEAPSLPASIDASEYRDPSFKLERTLTEFWEGLVPRRDASRPVYWTIAHIRWLEDGLLGDQIEETLLRGGGRDSTDDQRTRNLLRRLGGLPHVRGKVSVLSDSPMSRAWWRGKVASEIAESTTDDLNMSATDVHRVLHSHNDAWARLIGDSVHRITVMNQPRVRAALVKLYEGASRDGQPVQPLEMQSVARLLSRHGAVLALSHIDWNDLSELAREAFERARAEAAHEAQIRAVARGEKSRAVAQEANATQPNGVEKRKSRWASLLPFSRN